MVNQEVVRTYPRNYTNTTTNLQNLLDRGYKVAHITPLPDGIIEYIVEKQQEDDLEDC